MTCVCLVQGWCVQSSDPRTLGINSSPKEVIPGQVVTPNLYFLSFACLTCVFESCLHSETLKNVPIHCFYVVMPYKVYVHSTDFAVEAGMSACLEWNFKLSLHVC